MAGYGYRGNELDAHIIAPEHRRNPTKKRPSCGRRSGYILHRRYKEDACQPCLDANAAYLSEYWYRTKAKKVPA